MLCLFRGGTRFLPTWTCPSRALPGLKRLLLLLCLPRGRPGRGVDDIQNSTISTLTTPAAVLHVGIVSYVLTSLNL